MTQGERINNLRKYLGFTLEKFGEKLGVTKTAISRIENGERRCTEQMVKAICRENWNGNFVREDWLKTGTGDMFVKQSPADETASLLQDMMVNDNVFYDVIYSILDEFQHLDSKNREAFLIFTQKVVDNFQKKRKKEDIL